MGPTREGQTDLSWQAQSRGGRDCGNRDLGLEEGSVQQTFMTGETLRLYRDLFICLVCPVTPSPQIAATPVPPPHPPEKRLLAVYEHE